MKLLEIIEYLEIVAPLSYQESYDNSGLLVGDKNMNITSVLTCLDCTEEIIEEAISGKCNLIISHHPIIFNSIKKITNSNYNERVIYKAIKNDIAIYSMHTNLDNIDGGVSFILSNKLGLLNSKILKKKENTLTQLITYCPKKDIKKVEDALFNVGAGKVGSKYDQCSFISQGLGSFRPLENANPYIGSKNKRSFQDENRLELIFPTYLEKQVMSKLFEIHPYEEVAYELIRLANKDTTIGSGVIGDLNKEMDVISFFKLLKKIIPCQVLKHTKFSNKTKVKKIAFCGGSGVFLINEAIFQKADIYITSDFKYHDFFEVDNKIIAVDIGHYESEQFVPNLISEILKKKFPKLAIILTQINTNPISYY